MQLCSDAFSFLGEALGLIKGQGEASVASLEEALLSVYGFMFCTVRVPYTFNKVVPSV